MAAAAYAKFKCNGVSDIIINYATPGAGGLMSSADKAKLDAISGTGGSGSVSIGDPIGGGLSRSVLFLDTGGVLAQDNPSFRYNPNGGFPIFQILPATGFRQLGSIDLRSTTAASAGLPSNLSPDIYFRGKAWDGSNSRTIGYDIYVEAITNGSASYTTDLEFYPDRNTSLASVPTLRLSWNGTYHFLTCNGVGLYNAAQNVAAVALTDAANIATDAYLSNVFTVTLAGSRQLDNPTNLVAGGTYIWVVKQDNSGTHTLSYGNLFTWPGGTVPTLSTAANAVDVITAVYDGTKLRAQFTGNFS